MRHALAGTIVMTLSSIFSATSPGLRYAAMETVARGAHGVSGTVQVTVAQARTTGGKAAGADISLRLQGLRGEKRYGVYLGYGGPGLSGAIESRVLGVFTAHGTTAQVSFPVRGVAAIPETGWSVLVQAFAPHAAEPRAGAWLELPGAAVTGAGTFRSPYTYTPIGRSIVLGRYLVVLDLGPRLPVVAWRSAPRKGMQADAYVAAAQGGSPAILPVKDAGHAVNLRVRLHVFDLSTGRVVTTLHPQVSVYSDRRCYGVDIVRMAHLYNARVGMPDFQYASDVYLPPGSYSAMVQIGSARATFAGLGITDSTYQALNPAALPPAAVVKERDGRFVPAVVRVRTGAKVEFIFGGEGADQIRVAQATSPVLLAGQSWTYTAGRPGTYTVRLVYAPTVRMRLVVTPLP